MVFRSYIDKRGFQVIGERPMFEDTDEEDLGRDIKAKLFEVFGHYPILDISESWTLEGEGDEFDFEPIKLRDYCAVLDTEKLDQIGCGLSYVQFLFEKIIRTRLERTSAIDLTTYSSKKYCFSDTPDWWEAMSIEDLPNGRERFTLMVTLG